MTVDFFLVGTLAVLLVVGALERERSVGRAGAIGRNGPAHALTVATFVIAGAAMFFVIGRMLVQAQ